MPRSSERLARLAPDQRAAATAPPGPLLCVAPAGSGKTTTLVARIAWLVDVRRGPPGRDRGDHVQHARRRGAARAAGRRPSSRSGVGEATVRVRTFHALGLRDPARRRRDRRAARRPARDPAAGRSGGRSGRLAARSTPRSRGSSSTSASTADEVARRPGGGPDRAGVRGVRAGGRGRPAGWTSTTSSRARCGSSSPTPAAARALAGAVRPPPRRRGPGPRPRPAPPRAAPGRAGEPRVLRRRRRPVDLRVAAGRRAPRAVARRDSLPGLRRVDLVVNYRCPPTVVERAVRLVEHNRERFAKRSAPGPAATGRIVLARDSSDETVRDRAGRGALAGRRRRPGPSSPGRTASCCRRSPSALDRRLPFRPPAVELLVDVTARRRGPDEADGDDRRRLPTPRPARGASEPVLGGREPSPMAATPIRTPRRRTSPRRSSRGPSRARRSPRCATRSRHAGARPRRALPRRRAADASRRRTARRASSSTTSRSSAWTPAASRVAVPWRSRPEPERALEEERRLAYVAWTRARRSLTLVYDPLAPSEFLLEAFTAEELGIDANAA